jgi:hypothetical protein
VLELAELMEVYFGSKQFELSVVDEHKPFFAGFVQGAYLLYLQFVKRIGTVFVNPSIDVNWVEFSVV